MESPPGRNAAPAEPFFSQKRSQTVQKLVGTVLP